MKFLFIDESERQKNKENRYFFCLCGIMVDRDNLLTLENHLKNFKETNELSNLKELRGSLPSKKDRTNELHDILELHKAKVMSVIFMDMALKGATAEDTYFDALTFLIERFYINLKNDEKLGIIVFDSISTKLENSIKKKFSEFISKENHTMHGHVNGQYRNKIYPSLFFSNDDYSTILQATDLIATSLNSAVYNCILEEGELADIESLHEYNEYLKIYWSLFVKDSKEKVNGWGIKVWH